MSSSVPNIGGTFGPVQSRKRALTRTLLGSEYEETVTSILDPPQPLQNLSGDTAQRVRKGLRYADTTLRHPERKISPGGGIALELYKDTCVGLLDMLDVDEGEIFETTAEKWKAVEDSHRAFIREAEKGIQISACMQITRTNSAQELQDEILNLQRTAFYGKYGDYFAEICNNLRVAAEKGKLAGWQSLSKEYWSDIARRVREERPMYEKFLQGETEIHEQAPTTHAIAVACYALGLDPDDTLEIVQQYGIRNSLLHANLLPMIKKGLFADLAYRLFLDRTDVPLLIPASDKVERKIFEGLLDSIIDMWFQKDDLDPENHQMWTAKSELKSKYLELKASPAGNEAKSTRRSQKRLPRRLRSNCGNQSRRMS